MTYSIIESKSHSTYLSHCLVYTELNPASGRQNNSKEQLMHAKETVQVLNAKKRGTNARRAFKI